MEVCGTFRGASTSTSNLRRLVALRDENSSIKIISDEDWTESGEWLSERLRRSWLIKINVNLYLPHSSHRIAVQVISSEEFVQITEQIARSPQPSHALNEIPELNEEISWLLENNRQTWRETATTKGKNWDNLIDCFLCLIYLFKPAQTMGNELPACIRGGFSFY